MEHSFVEDEMREMIKRLIELPELNMDDLEFRSEMVVRYARALIKRTTTTTTT